MLGFTHATRSANLYLANEMIHTIHNFAELSGIQKKGYSKLPLDFDDLDELYEIKAWCRENCDNDVYLNVDEYHVTASYVYFSSEQDAILYKLARS